MSQKCREFRVSTIVMETAAALRQLAEPRPGGDRIKCAIARAARRAGLSYWRAYDLWYGRARRVDATEAEKIKAARVGRARGAAREYFEWARTLEALAERASRVDEEFARPYADAMRDLARNARRLADGD
jgi:hypothetical protein